MKGFTLVLSVCFVCTAGFGITTDDLYSESYRQGLEHVRLGNMEDAKKSFQDALLYRPNDSEAQTGIQLCDEYLNAERQKMEAFNGTITSLRKHKNPGVPNSRMERKRGALSYVPGVNDYNGETFSDGGGFQVEYFTVNRSWAQSNPDRARICETGFFLARHDGRFGDSELAVTALGCGLQAGGAIRVGDAVILEGMPFIGLGFALRSAKQGFIATGDLADYARYGIKGGVFIKTDPDFEVGLELGYNGFYSYNSGQSISGHGVFGGVVIVWDVF